MAHFGMEQDRRQAGATPADAAEKGTAPPLSTLGVVPAVAASATVAEHFGRYRILQQLGQGGMGAVYLAQDTQLDRRVALKVPRVGKENPAVLERFQREARAAATLRHPNICPVYDVGEAEGVPYLTMAYLEGRPLSQFLR